MVKFSVWVNSEIYKKKMIKFITGIMFFLFSAVSFSFSADIFTDNNGNYNLIAKHLSLKFSVDKGIITEITVDGIKYYTNAGFYVEDLTNKVRYNKGYCPYESKAENINSGKNEKSAWISFSLISARGKWKINTKITLSDDYGFSIYSELEDTGSSTLRELESGFVIGDSKLSPNFKIKKSKIFRPDKDRDCIIGNKPSTYNFWGFYPPGAPEGTGDTCGTFAPINVYYNNDLCIGLIGNPYTQYQIFMFKESMQNLYKSFGLTKGQVAKDLNTYIFIKPKSDWRDVMSKYYELYPELIHKGKDYGPMMIVDGFPNDDKWLADISSKGIKTILFWQYYPEDGWFYPRTEPWEIERYGGKIKLDWKLLKEFVDKCHSHNLKIIAYAWVGAVFPAYLETKKFQEALIKNENGKTIYPTSYLPKVIGFMSLDPRYGYIQDATEQLYQGWLKTGFDGYLFDEVHFAGVDDVVHKSPDGIYTTYNGKPSCSLLYQDSEGWKYMKNYFESKGANIDIILNTWDTVKSPYTVASWQDNYMSDFNFRSYSHIKLIFPKMSVGTFGHWDDNKVYDDQSTRLLCIQHYILWNHFYNAGKSKLDLMITGGFLQDYGFQPGPSGTQMQFFKYHKKIMLQQYYVNEHQYAEWVPESDVLQILGIHIELCNWDVSNYSVWYNLFSLGNGDYDVRLWNNTPESKSIVMKLNTKKLNIDGAYRYYDVNNENNKIDVTSDNLEKGISVILEPNESKIIVLKKIR